MSATAGATENWLLRFHFCSPLKKCRRAVMINKKFFIGTWQNKRSNFLASPKQRFAEITIHGWEVFQWRIPISARGVFLSFISLVTLTQRRWNEFVIFRSSSRTIFIIQTHSAPLTFISLAAAGAFAPWQWKPLYFLLQLLTKRRTLFLMNLDCEMKIN